MSLFLFHSPGQPVIENIYSAGACVAHAESMRIFLGNDDLNWDIEFKAGESRIEPGTLPPTNVSYRINTFSDFEYECGQSRMWAGVHFQVTFVYYLLCFFVYIFCLHF